MVHIGVVYVRGYYSLTVSIIMNVCSFFSLPIIWVLEISRIIWGFMGTV